MAQVLIGLAVSYAINRWIVPLFGEEEIEGSRLSDRQLQLASEGAPMNLCIGPENRCAGTAIWMTDLHEQRIVEHVGGGGKGGGGGGGYTSVSYRYSVDAAIAVCEGEIDAIQKIWANGKLIYDVGSDVGLTSDKLSIQQAKLEGGYRYGFITSASDGPDLTAQLFQVGETVTVTGFADDTNNHEYEILKVKAAELTSETIITVRCTLPDTIATEAAGEDVTLFQANRAYSLGKWTDLRIYTGTQTQVADSLIAATEGAANTPAFRGTAYVVFEGLQLADFGNMLPQFSFMVRGQSGGQYPVDTIASFDRNLLKGSNDFDYSGGHWTRYPDSDVNVIVTPNCAYGHDGKGLTAHRLFLQYGSGPGSQIYQVCGSVPVGKVAIASIWMRSRTGANQSVKVAIYSYNTTVTVTPAWQRFEFRVDPYMQTALRFSLSQPSSVTIDIDIEDAMLEYDAGLSAAAEYQPTEDRDGTHTNVELDSLSLTPDANIGETLAVGDDEYPVIDNGQSWVRVTGDVDGDGHSEDDALTVGPTWGVVTIAYALDTLLARAGLSAAEYDTSEVTGTMRGIVVSGPAPPLNAARALVQAYNLVVQDIAGVLTFRMRNALTADTVTASDLGAHEWGQDAERPGHFEDAPETDMPSAVEVSFIDADADYQAGMQRAEMADPPATNVKALRLPLTLSADEALAVAMRQLWTIWAGRRTVKLQLPPSYLWLRENDLLQVTLEGETYDLLVQRVERGHNWLIVAECVVEEQQTLTQSGTAATAPDSGATVYTPPPLCLAVLDLPPLSDAAALSPGFYVAVAAFDPDASFTGAVLYSSADDLAYSISDFVNAETTIGECTTTLADGIVGRWDNANTLTVELYHGELESRTELEVLNGANFALVGDEVIAFKTATLVDNDTYQLSGLLRGMRGTEGECDGHAAHEVFVLLNSAGLICKDANLATVGTSRYYKAVPNGGVAADVEGQSFAFAGRALKPFAPCHVTGARDGSNNLTLTWVRRTRAIADAFADGEIPLLEESEAYEVDIMSGSTVLRTITATSPTCSYTAAQQTADGLTPGDPVTVRVYQISASVGRGYTNEEVV
jgi:hypothetical protein